MRRQSGLTLVELMVAMTLSMVLLAGVMVLFSGNKISYRMQEGLSAIQDSGRYAMAQIKRDIESSGFGGCLTEDLKVDIKPILAIYGSVVPAYVGEFQNGIRITADNDVSGADVDGEAVVDGTDVLQIRGLMGGTVFYAAQRMFPNNPITLLGDATDEFATDDYAVLSDCSGADIVQVAADPTFADNKTTITHLPTLLSRKFGSDSELAALSLRTYFIGTSAGVNNSGAAVRALYRSDGTTVQEIVQGVEDMQILFGVDTNADGVADAFQAPDAVADWSGVVNVQVSLLVNSIDNTTEEAAQYIFRPDDPAPQLPATDDRLMRQEYTAVMTLRNNVL